MAERHLFTSESVTEGHPDKIADQISDSVLDALLAKDRMSRVACETLVTTGLAIVAGEISSRGYVEIPELVRRGIGEKRHHSPADRFRHPTRPARPPHDKPPPETAPGGAPGRARRERR